MREVLDGPEFSRLLGAFEQTAFRFEQQTHYVVPFEQEPFRRWLDGDQTPLTATPEYAEWIGQIRTLTRAGRRYERVRVRDEPPTDYQRWEDWAGQWNTAAGEVIHQLPRSKAYEIGLLPAAGDTDWWLLDDEALIVMSYDATGRRALAEYVDDPAEVAQARLWRDLAVHHSVHGDEGVART